MKANILISLILAGSLGSVAQAQTEAEQSSNTSTVKASDVQKKDETVKDIDDEIVNARMRATLGSKSKWSFKSAFGYNGGSIERPLTGYRPNYRAGASVESVSALNGTLGINYRMSEAGNLSLTTGLSVIDPLHGNIAKPINDPRKGRQNRVLSRYEVSTPSLEWNRGYKAAGMQMISSVSYSHYTDADSVNDSRTIGDFSLNQTLLAELGTSLSGGLSLSFANVFFNGDVSDEARPDYASGDLKRENMLIGLYPFAEYSMTDTLSLRTVFGYFEFGHYKNEYDSKQEFFQREPYQSVGIGISVTRDIYLYPNIQFAPKDIRADRTNVALSTNINLF